MNDLEKRIVFEEGPVKSEVMNMELLDIYDEKRKHIGQASKDEVHKKGLWHFLVQITLYDSDNIYFIRKKGSRELSTFLEHVQEKERLEDTSTRTIRKETGLDFERLNVELIDIITKQSTKEKNNTVSIDNVFVHIVIANIEKQKLDFNFLDKKTESMIKINTKELQKLLQHTCDSIDAYEYTEKELKKIVIHFDDFLTGEKYENIITAILFRQKKMPNRFHMTNEENIFIAKNKLDLDYLLKINSFVSRNESLDPGHIRTGKAGINGVDYIPPIPDEELIKKKIQMFLYNNRSVLDC